MGVRFVVGRAGSGKTHYLLDRICGECLAEPLGPPVIFLVPEQASYQAERAILEHGSLRGYTRAQVLSFSRLAEYVFAQLPTSRLPRLTTNHRELIVAMLVARRRLREEKTLLTLPGVEEALAAFVSESRSQATGPEDLRRVARSLMERQDAAESTLSGGLLARKLNYLAELVEEFDATIAARFQDPSESLISLSDHILKSDLFQGAIVLVDGFLGFTPVEEQLLVALARKSRELILAFPMLPDRFARMLQGEVGSRDVIFAAVEEQVERLLSVFHGAGVRIDDPVFCPAPGAKQRYGSKNIANLEASFLRGDGKGDGADGATEAWVCESTRDEARLAAELVVRLLQENPGWLYEDVGIIARDLAPYAEHLELAFKTLAIPYFIDHSQPLATHPLVTGTQALLRVAVNPSRTDAYIDLAKSGLIGIDRADADLLEDHIRQYPRSIGQWLGDAPWKAPRERAGFRDDEGEEQEDLFSGRIDEVRRIAVAAAQSLRNRIAPNGEKEGRFGGFLRALADTLHELLEANGFPETDRPILRRLGELLSEANDATGVEVMDWNLAADLVIRVLASLTMPRIPPQVNQLFVGQINRSRVPSLRAVIVLGLAEGAFPKAVSNLSMLNDSERDKLEEMGLQLRPSARHMFQREPLHAYRAFAAASDRLLLLRPRNSVGSQALQPSQWWNEALATLGIREITAPDPHDPQRAWRLRELAVSACRLIDQSHQRYNAESVAGEFLSRIGMDISDGEVRRVLAAEAWKNEAWLDPELVAKTWSKTIKGSASQFENFARCPFNHFIKHMVRPRERIEPRFSNMDAGNFAHAVLQNFTRLVREADGAEIVASQPAIFEAICQKALDIPHKKLAASPLLESALGQFLVEQLEKILRDMMQHLLFAFQQLPTVPIGEEVSMAMEPDKPSYTAVNIIPNWDLELRGVVDRIDTSGSESEFLVVDYKLRGKRFDFGRWETGENLQLPLYLLAVKHLSGGKAKPMGGLYLEVIPQRSKDAWKDRKYKGVVRQSMVESLGKDLKKILDFTQLGPHEPAKKGGANIHDAQFEKLLEETEGLLKGLIEQMVEGDVGITPARHGKETACTYCPLQRSVCYIDYRVNQARQLSSRNKLEVLERLAGVESSSNFAGDEE